jgi:succinate dehydrogenase / fumarate reductase flavoprotein subunit
VASRAAKERCDEGFGVGESGLAVYLDFADAISRLGEDTIRERYGNLFQMYEKIAAENPYKTPMRIFPAVHYTMGGLWVDYNLQTTVPGLFALGECNFSDHGANRLGASALMQGLADGYFVAPYTVSNYLGEHGEMDAAKKVTTEHPAFDEAEAAVIARTERLLAVNGTQSIDSFHKRLGLIMWDNCGMGRTKETLTKALEEIPKLREEFWSDVRIPGGDKEFNAEVEKANRVADFLEFAETMCLDALTREESCGGHFREEHQSGEGEAQRDDENYAHASVWEYTGEGNRPELSIEQLEFENVMLSTRSYK